MAHIPQINPNKRKAKVNGYSQSDVTDKAKQYPLFVDSLELLSFRHLKNLKIEFKSPITVITGSNCTGKSSILLCLGCSHYNFMTRNPISGEFQRTRWGEVMRFTAHDRQTEDWEYIITHREGVKSKTLQGKRKCLTKKWGGCAKKELQIGHPAPNVHNSPNGRHVYLIDMERIIPGRHHPQTIYNKVKDAPKASVNKLVDTYLSYILENVYRASVLGNIGERIVYSYDTNDHYSSFNSASGEDVLTRMLIDIVAAKDNSLILIEEIEIGLHPQIQRRLMDILYCESSRAHKQFIITSHSPSIISSVKTESRILLNRKGDDSIGVHQGISINAAMSTMDSISYPLMSIYVEDKISANLVHEALEIVRSNRPELIKMVKIVEIGKADKVYNYTITRIASIDADQLHRRCICVIDGDKRNEKLGDWTFNFPQEDFVFFHYSNDAPERMLLKEFLKHNQNRRLSYHATDGNAHNLMQKIADEGLAVNAEAAFHKCVEYLKANPDGQRYLDDLAEFIVKACDSVV